METSRQQYWIHGNGLSSQILPKGVLGHDMYGHGKEKWDLSKYSIDTIADYYSELIPKNAHVTGHSLGGHIAINVLIRRPDLTMTAMGMIPGDTVEQVFTGLKPLPEFTSFTSQNRTYQDLVNLVQIYTSDLSHQSSFLNAMLDQDPMFSETLFSKGLENYDFNERVKAKELGNRFELVVNKLDPLLDYDMALSLDLPKREESIFGHCPWTPKSLISTGTQNLGQSL